MGVAGHDDVQVAFSLLEQSVLETGNEPGDSFYFIPQVEPDIEGNLVVS